MEPDQRNSRLGVASVSVWGAGVLCAAALILPGWMKLSQTRMGGSGEDLILSGIALYGVFSLAAFGLGVAALCQQRIRKSLAILGTGLGGLVLPALIWALVAWVRWDDPAHKPPHPMLAAVGDCKSKYVSTRAERRRRITRKRKRGKPKGAQRTQPIVFGTPNA